MGHLVFLQKFSIMASIQYQCELHSNFKLKFFMNLKKIKNYLKTTVNNYFIIKYFNLKKYISIIVNTDL